MFLIQSIIPCFIIWTAIVFTCSWSSYNVSVALNVFTFDHMGWHSASSWLAVYLIILVSNCEFILTSNDWFWPSNSCSIEPFLAIKVSLILCPSERKIGSLREHMQVAANRDPRDHSKAVQHCEPENSIKPLAQHNAVWHVVKLHPITNCYHYSKKLCNIILTFIVE